MSPQEEEELEFTHTSEAEWDRFDAELGAEHRAQRGEKPRPWILSDRDVWYKNPFYQGPPVPHPESSEAQWTDEDWAEAVIKAAKSGQPITEGTICQELDRQILDDCPF